MICGSSEWIQTVELRPSSQKIPGGNVKVRSREDTSQTKACSPKMPAIFRVTKDS